MLRDLWPWAKSPRLPIYGRYAAGQSGFLAVPNWAALIYWRYSATKRLGDALLGRGPAQGRYRGASAHRADIREKIRRVATIDPSHNTSIKGAHLWPTHFIVCTFISCSARRIANGSCSEMPNRAFGLISAELSMRTTENQFALAEW